VKFLRDQATSRERFPLFNRSFLFADNEFQAHNVEQATQFIDADVLFSAFDAIQLLATQASPSRKFRLRHT